MNAAGEVTARPLPRSVDRPTTMVHADQDGRRSGELGFRDEDRFIRVTRKRCMREP